MRESMTTLWLFSNKYFLLSTQWFVIQALHVPFLCVFSIVLGVLCSILHRSLSCSFHHLCAFMYYGLRYFMLLRLVRSIVECPLSDADFFSVATNDLAMISKTRHASKWFISNNLLYLWDPTDMFHSRTAVWHV